MKFVFISKIIHTFEEDLEKLKLKIRSRKVLVLGFILKNAIKYQVITLNKFGNLRL